ncbi:DEAD/DEAH box helicase [Pontibacillus litoralis]|uniref:Helicase SNF2 n=1 Tax=Pontibacillus litoralis JSM 072002 TaxID=1385512 RepID=A0A0A5G5F9_9BACI|nr:DEAD/DEAH box helicase [Pontibacillus litoralis]KGX86330.1 hypothetical protein N784_05110 [Pontibacillus litoralis JSM 072002]
MIEITASEILELSGWLTYKRGASYYEKAAVKKLEQVNHAQTPFIQFHAQVAGNRSTPYHVHVQFFKGSGSYLSSSCSCPAFEDGMSECKHIVAVLMEIMEHYTSNRSVWKKQQTAMKERIPSLREIQEATSFVDHLIENATTEDDVMTQHKEPLQMQFELKGLSATFSTPTLSIKAGTSRLYVVKDISTFIEAWENEDEVYFTNHYTYDPKQQIMAKEDAEVLTYLAPLVKSLQFFRDYHHTRENNKELTIPEHFMEGLLERLELCEDVRVSQHSQSYPYCVKHHTFPETFALAKEGNYYAFMIKDNGFISKQIADTSYFLKDNILYKVNHSIRSTVIPIYRHLSQSLNHTQLLKQEHVEQLAGTLFPVLEAHDLLEIDPAIKNDLKREECKPIMELDKHDTGLRALLLFQYGDEVMNPFLETGRDSEQMIARNMQKERHVMRLIEQANFHWNGEVLSLQGSYNLGMFFYEILPELEKHATVVKSAEVVDMYHDLPPDMPFSFDIDESHGWFDIRFPTEDISDEDIRALFQSLKSRNNYYQLHNGKIVDLEAEAWSNTRSLIEELQLDEESFEDGVIHLPKYRALQVDTSLGVQQSEAFGQLVEAIKHPETSHEQLPSSLQADLRDYQLRGFQWLRSLSRHGFGGVLADEMGLGKTLQGLSYILAGRQERPEADPFLVVAPSSLIYNWEQEAAKFTPSLHVRVIAGAKEERREQLANLEGVDLIITSYPILRRDIDLYQPYFFQGVLLDEAQSFKNYTSLTYKAVRSIRAETAFALTGTPVENRAEELWTLFSVVMPGLLYDRKTFKQVPQSMIKKKISPFVLRRTKREVLTELPDKIQTTRYTELSKEQRQLYVGYLQEIQQQTKTQLETGGLQQNRMQILSNLTRLRQLCCHPSLFVENYQGESGKLEELRTFIQEAHENGQRLLIFSQFTSMLQLIADMVEKEGLSYYYLDGSTPSQERLAMSNQFNDGEKDLFLISLKAGGTGLNLVGADTVVLYDLWWNPAVEQQAADRAHRIGQKSTVQVVKMIAQGTIEEKIQALQEKKQDLFDTLIQSGEGNLSALTEEDIREILSI